MLKKFSKNIFVSGEDEIKDKARLKELGITAVLNVAWESTDPLYITQDFKMVKVGLTDDIQNPPYLKNLAVMALASLLDNGETVVVHCLHGASRSPYIVLRYLAEKEHRTIQALYEEFRSQFPEGQVNYSPLLNE